MPRIYPPNTPYATNKAIKGVIYSKSFFTNASDFNVTGFTPTFSSGAIVFPSGADNFSQFMDFPSITDDENLTIEVDFSMTGTSDGLAIGRRSISLHGGDLSTRVQCGNNGNNMHHYTNGATVQSASGLISNGDLCTISWSQTNRVFDATLYNATKGVLTRLLPTSMISNLLTSAGFNFLPCNISYPCIYNFNGQCNITRITIKSRSLYAPDYMCIGDSKTLGFGASSTGSRWADLIGRYGSIMVYAGGGNITAECLSSAVYGATFNPKNIILNIGRNDLANSISSGTWQANYQSIVAAYQAVGARVIHLLPIPEVTQTQTTLTSWIQSTYAGQPMIDPSTGWVNGTDVDSDNIHPSQQGHALIAKNIINSGLLG